MISRRGLITGLISFVAAPAIVRVSSLMPVKNLLLEATDWKILYVQRLHEALDDAYRQTKESIDDNLLYGFGWANMKNEGTVWRLEPVRQEMDQAVLRMLGPISRE